MDWFKDSLYKQLELQENAKGVCCCNDLPNVKDMYGAATGMIIEIGEMLQCDTRWKREITMSKKEPYYNKEQFLEECADVFIYFMNVLIYGDIRLDEFKRKVLEKQEIVKERFNA